MHCGWMNNKNTMMRQPLLLLLLCAATAIQHSAAAAAVNPRGRATKEPGDQTLHSFTWLQNSDNATLRVCFGWNETGTETEVPSKPFELTYTREDSSELAVWSDDDPEMLDQGICCFNVAVDPATISHLTEQTYGVNSADVRAFAEFRMSMQPGTLSTESLIASNTTRVGGLTGDYSLPACTPYDSPYCFLNSSSTPDQLCTQSDDTLNPGNSIFVCDSTFAKTVVNAQTAGTNAVLYYNDTTSTIHVSAAGSEGSTLQILLRDPTTGSYTECEGSTCAAERPGESVYFILIVEVNETSHATSSSNVIIQDLNLTVVSSDPVVDFHFANKRDERKYEVYSKLTPEAMLEGEPITLDCTRVPQEQPCFAFVRADDLPPYIAVRYGDQTNEVVTKVIYPAH